MAFTKPRSSTGAVLGARLKPLNMLRWNGSAGSTIKGCLNQPETSRQHKLRKTIMLRWTKHPWQRNLNQIASGNPGAVQLERWMLALKIFENVLAHSDKTRFYWLVVFLFMVFFLGGGSRDDIQSLIILRPLSVIFAAYAIVSIRPAYIRMLGTPFYILCALSVAHVVQLIPLPPGFWTSLPERGIYGQIANIAGIEQPWRPISLSPSKTWNSFFALFVPFAAYLLYSIQGDKYRAKVIPVFIALSLLSGFIGVLQLAESQKGLLYFYRYTNASEPVGLFANNNHQMLLISITIAMLGWYVASQGSKAKLAGVKSGLSIVAIALCLTLILVSGSRAGIGFSALTIFGALYFVYSSNVLANRRVIKIGKRKLSARQLTLFGFALAILGILSLITYASRANALDQLLTDDPLGGLRLKVLPVLVEMVKAYFPFGSGFGSFEHVYKQFEYTEILRQTYLNQAHNDWLQFLIEGGLAAILLIVAGGIWLAASSFKLFAMPPSRRRQNGLIALFAIGLFGLSSVIDYPLRVPSLMALFLIFCAILKEVTSEEN